MVAPMDRKPLYGAPREQEYVSVGDKRFCRICKEEVDCKMMHGCLTEDNLDTLQWAKDFMERYEKKHARRK